jgi:hypothetical protein
MVAVRLTLGDLFGRERHVRRLDGLWGMYQWLDRAADAPAAQSVMTFLPNHPRCLEDPVRYLSPSDALTRFAISNEWRSNAICRKSRACT